MGDTGFAKTAIDSSPLGFSQAGFGFALFGDVAADRLDFVELAGVVEDGVVEPLVECELAVGPEHPMLVGIDRVFWVSCPKKLSRTFLRSRGGIKSKIDPPSSSSRVLSWYLQYALFTKMRIPSGVQRLMRSVWSSTTLR